LDRLLVFCLLSLTCLALSGLGTPARADVTVLDDRGREIRLPAPASRVIALYGAFNEILADLGREDIIVARTSTSSAGGHGFSSRC
jgi:iron complex transport system substrate-binding protein